VTKAKKFSPKGELPKLPFRGVDKPKKLSILENVAVDKINFSEKKGNAFLTEYKSYPSI
jgi:hypothetical protein